MDRRNAIKRLGVLAAGGAYSTTILSLLASCGDEAAKGLAWKPESFTASGVVGLTHILDVIIPSGDIPGALDIGLPRFFDRYMSKVVDEGEKDYFNSQLTQFIQDFEKSVGKKVTKASREEMEAFVTEVFSSNNSEDGNLVFLRSVRDKSLEAWKNSKMIATKYMWYDPIPGKNVGCRPLNAEGEGKLMAL